MSTPISVLDLAPVGEGRTSAEAIADAVDTAVAADRLGYARYWTAEHHNMPAVAATSPGVLLSALTQRTERIHLGSGGVMLPNHSPLVVAEQFSVLEALAPGRIDLGLGRAPGTDPVTARALRGGDLYGTVEDFPHHVQELMGLLGRERERAAGYGRGLDPTPAPASFPGVWVLGSSTFGAHLAARLGLPYVFANHFRTGTDVDDAVAAYRSNFTPADGTGPRMMVTASIAVAPTQEEAELIDRTARLQTVNLVTNRLAPMRRPEDVRVEDMDEKTRLLYEKVGGAQYVGTAEDVAEGLRTLVERTRADELMITSTLFDVAHRVRALESLASVWSD